MSRQSTAAQRNLTLTEELEKLEQSITLTLQEIDHNFSRAHRIVTTSILPIVDNYREHSTQVWEGSKFWKQFFEASANVSLSGYEEPPPEDSQAEEDEEEQEATTTASPSASAQATPSSASYASPPAAHDANGDEATLTPNNKPNSGAGGAGDYSPSPPRTTPRPKPKGASKSTRTPRAGNHATSKAPYASPYESLKRETLGESPTASDPPSTPRAQASPRKPSSPQSSPFAPPSTYRRAGGHRTPSNNNNNDVLLHRVLDKNWRIQATPHSTARLPYRTAAAAAAGAEHHTPAKPSTARKAARHHHQNQPQDDLDSSPAAPAPELHAEIFDTPARKGASRVPGVSVLTPARNVGGGGGGGAKKPGTPAAKQAVEIDLWDSDEEIDGQGGVEGMSPPKTMQFHIPQGRLVKTPAREASKRIVEDLLMTAGMNDEGLEDGEEGEEEEGSPSIVKTRGLLEEDTF